LDWNAQSMIAQCCASSLAPYY